MKKNATFNKFLLFIGMMAVISCVFFMPITSHAADGFPIQPSYNLDVLSPTDIINWVNVNTNFNEVSTTQYLIILERSNDYYYWFDVYCTPLPMASGSFIGEPLSIIDYDYPIHISAGTYTQSYELRYDKSDGSMREYARTDNFIKSADSVLYCSSRPVYFSGSEDIAINRSDIGSEPSDPTPSDPDFGHGQITEPDFDQFGDFGHSTDTSGITSGDVYNRTGDLANLIKEGFKSIIGNFSSFLKPSLDGIRQSVDNFKSDGIPIFNDIKNLIGGLKDDLFSFLDDIKDSIDFIKSSIKVIGDVFEDFVNLGTSSDGSFSIFTAIRRLIIPDDFTTFQNRLSTFINDVDTTTGVKLYITTLSNFFDSLKTQNIPTFTVPSFTLGGATIPETVISFQFLVPYMGYIRAIMSAFMWLAFILYCIKDFPNILRGTFSAVDSSIEHLPDDSYKRSNIGF